MFELRFLEWNYSQFHKFIWLQLNLKVQATLAPAHASRSREHNKASHHYRSISSLCSTVRGGTMPNMAKKICFSIANAVDNLATFRLVQMWLTEPGWRWWASCRWWWVCLAPHRQWWTRGRSAGRCWGSQWRGTGGRSASPAGAPRWRSGSAAPCRSSSSYWSGCRRHRSTDWNLTCSGKQKHKRP